MTRHGAILVCGGRSSRMGRSKAWLPWRGQPIAAHVVSVLAQVVDEIVVVTSEALDPPPFPRRVRVVRDEQPDRGPLAGLAAGLACLDADVAFATGTDAPFLTPAFARCVLAAAGADGAAAAVVDGFVQPLGAAYPKRGAARARELVADADARGGPVDLLHALGFRALAAADLPDLASLRGLDTPAEYLAALAEDGQAGRAALELTGRAGALAGRAALEVPIGTLAQVLSHAPAGLAICVGERVAPGFRVSLGGREEAHDTGIPIGPGERVIVRDAGR